MWGGFVKKIPSIGEAEWQVMEVLWEKGQATFSEIRSALREHNWSQTTIHTMLTRLIKKGAVAIKEGTSPYLFYPLVSREECRRHETLAFLRRVYNGSVKLFLTNFVNDVDLSDEEIDELLKVLEKCKTSEHSHEGGK